MPAMVTGWGMGDFVETLELSFELTTLQRFADDEIEEAAVASGFELPVGAMAVGAADGGKKFPSGFFLRPLMGFGGAGMIELIPLDQIEIAFGEFVGLAVAVGVVTGAAHSSGVIDGLACAAVGERFFIAPCIAVGVVQRGRVVGL